ncbi:hypothetical protein HDU67_000410 [Dinochytrium kinnereticum]|nr:hypothetical protein HDU67_000410 [Dinochytrium kinnereticum]
MLSCRRRKPQWLPLLRFVSTAADKPKSKVKEVVQVVRRGESSILTRLTLADPSPQRERLKNNVWIVLRTVNDGTKPVILEPISRQLPSTEHRAGEFLTHKARSAFLAVKNTLIMTFLPKSYPESVTPDYLPYTLWHFAHSVSGTITGTLSTQALLQALGMGVSASIGIAATTNWIIKDGFGLLGGVLYAAFFGSRFDSQARRYRFLAAISIQLATISELLTPLVPHLFLPMASLSNVGKNVGWLAASATKASMHKGFAKGDNLGDITAKSGAQATLAGLVGTTGGIAISWFMATVSGGTVISPWTMLWVFAPISAFNLWSAYRANLAVVTRSINVERGELALYECISKLCAAGTWDQANIAMALNAMPCPKAIGEKEAFVMPFRSAFRVPLDVEPPIDWALGQMDVQSAETFLEGTLQSEGQDRARNYRIFVSFPLGTPRVSLWFLEGSTPEDHIRGFYHACVMRNLLEMKGNSASANVTEMAARLVDLSFDSILERFKRLGWMTEYTHLADRNARITIG